MISPTVSKPLERMTKAVSEQTTIVSMKGPSIATRPSRTGSFVFAAPCASGAVPSPASFEKAARRTPIIIACWKPIPIAPPAAAVPVKASRKMRPNTSTATSERTNRTQSAMPRYSTHMAGTNRPVTAPIRSTPPKATSATRATQPTPVRIGSSPNWAFRSSATWLLWNIGRQPNRPKVQNTIASGLNFLPRPSSIVYIVPPRSAPRSSRPR